MAFLASTIEVLRAKLHELEMQRQQYDVDLTYHAEQVTKCQAKLDGANKAIEDYASLLEYAEVTNGFGKPTTHDPAYFSPTAEQAARDLKVAIPALWSSPPSVAFGGVSISKDGEPR